MSRVGTAARLALAALAVGLGCGEQDWPEDRYERWDYCQDFIRRWEFDQNCGGYLTFEEELAQRLEANESERRVLGTTPQSRSEVERRLREEREQRGPGCTGVAKRWPEKEMRKLQACRIFLDAFREGRLD
jgi:hypothetical protein